MPSAADAVDGSELCRSLRRSTAKCQAVITKETIMFQSTYWRIDLVIEVKFNDFQPFAVVNLTQGAVSIAPNGEKVLLVLERVF
jgi:hypothetical protein